MPVRKNFQWKIDQVGERRSQYFQSWLQRSGQSLIFILHLTADFTDDLEKRGGARHKFISGALCSVDSKSDFLVGLFGHFLGHGLLIYDIKTIT